MLSVLVMLCPIPSFLYEPLEFPAGATGVVGCSLPGGTGVRSLAMTQSGHILQ